jgi:hypothetical protein
MTEPMTRAEIEALTAEQFLEKALRDMITIMEQIPADLDHEKEAHAETSLAMAEFIKDLDAAQAANANTFRAGWMMGVEAAADRIEKTAYTSNGDIRSLQPVSKILEGADMHHATIAQDLRALTPPEGDEIAAALQSLAGDIK